MLEALRRVLVHGDVDEGQQGEPQGLGVHQGPVAGDDAGFLQLADPAQAGGGGEADAVGQILIADAAILLEHLEDLVVVAVEFHGIAFLCVCGVFYF